MKKSLKKKKKFKASKCAKQNFKIQENSRFFNISKLKAFFRPQGKIPKFQVFQVCPCPVRILREAAGNTESQHARRFEELEYLFCLCVCRWWGPADGGEADVVLLDDGRVQAVEVQQQDVLVIESCNNHISMIVVCSCWFNKYLICNCPTVTNYINGLPCIFMYKSTPCISRGSSYELCLQYIYI